MKVNYIKNKIVMKKTLKVAFEAKNFKNENSKIH